MFTTFHSKRRFTLQKFYFRISQQLVKIMQILSYTLFMVMRRK